MIRLTPKCHDGTCHHDLGRGVLVTDLLQSPRRLRKIRRLRRKAVKELER